MKKLHSFLFVILLISLPCFSLFAADIGVILDQSVGAGGTSSDNNTDYSAMLIPRLTALIGDNGSLYLSAGMRVDYQNEKWSSVPELLRSEFTWSTDSGELNIGRMYYSDPLTFIADGLFDGARYSIFTGMGTFGIGAWYTGLLYKNRANIALSGEDMAAQAVEVDYSDLANTYFAPKRFVAAIDWEHPSIAELLGVNIAILGQFDLTDSKVNSQYLAAKIILPINDFVFDLGGCLELMQYPGADSSNETGIALAAELGVAWMLPTPIEDRLSILGRYSSGGTDNDSIDPFLPITTQNQGTILKAKLSGLSLISLDYIGRFHESFSLGVSSTYFMRSDLGTYFGYPVGAAESDGYLLGNEFFGQLIWSPVSDVQVTFGAGAFLPSMGNVAPDADALWRVELNVIMSLY